MNNNFLHANAVLTGDIDGHYFFTNESLKL